ncbi:MAG: SPASM domain-containing protein [Eubacteriales bacterium]|nr:SPASM domain-containing protein [Eubacteriales bacterium]
MNVLIKPAGAACNLACAYCFYCQLAKQRQVKSCQFLAWSDMAAFLDAAFKRAIPQLNLTFQGGEPTLRGLDFYRQVVSYVKEKSPASMRVNYAIQSNASLIDRAWARFLRDEEFLVGISLDGPPAIHDRYRRSHTGQASFEAVWSGIEALRAEQVSFNILTVVHRDLAVAIDEVYAFYREAGFEYQQYIACLDPIGDRGAAAWSLSPEVYGDFLIRLFDLWFDELCAGHYRSIGFFDQLILLLRGQLPTVCGMLGVCTAQYVIEADASVYPCDFYCSDAYLLGSIHDGLERLDERRRALQFLESSYALPPKCQRCRYLQVCRGQCRRQRDDGAELGLNYFCRAYQRFFDACFERLLLCAKRL